MDKFLGHEISYWIELQKRAESLETCDFIKEIVKLNGKVGFYEERIRQMYRLTKEEL